MCGSSSTQLVSYEIALSPKQLIDWSLAFIAHNDERAYNQLSPEQLKAHLIHSAFAGQLRVRLCIPPVAVTGVATWEVRHAAKEVHLVGIIGDKDFLQQMLEEWKTKYPFYDLTYFRKGVARRRTVKRNFNQN